MLYLFADIEIKPYSEDMSDILCAMLGEVDYDTFESTETGVRAYIPQDKFDEKQLKSVLDNFFVPDYEFAYTINELENKDWNEEWEKESFTPILEEQFGIKLNPRMAFGSGQHETTFQLVEYILQQDLKGCSVLDMGCGTGVLGIAMAKAGASNVTAIDIDDMSVKNARENFELNSFETLRGVEYIHGDASKIEGLFDVIVANIHKNILLNDLHIYVQHLKSGGTLLMSGFFTEDVVDLEKAVMSHDMEVADVLSKNNWAVIVVKKGDSHNVEM